MSDPFAGLSDRSRVMEPKADANVHIPVLQVDELVIGAISLKAVQGTRYANGRLQIKGRGDNSAEIEIHPGDDCRGRGVMTQILWYSQFSPDWFRRFGISVVNDGEADRVEVDSSSHENTYSMPVYMPVMGARSRSDGSDVPGTAHYSFSYFQNGTHELHLRNDTLRVEIASLAEAWLLNDKTLVKARQKNAAGDWEPVSYE